MALSLVERVRSGAAEFGEEGLAPLRPFAREHLADERFLGAEARVRGVIFEADAAARMAVDAGGMDPVAAKQLPRGHDDPLMGGQG